MPRRYPLWIGVRGIFCGIAAVGCLFCRTADGEAGGEADGEAGGKAGGKAGGGLHFSCKLYLTSCANCGIVKIPSFL